MAIVVIIDKSNGNDMLGFQKTYLSILHAAIRTQINLDVILFMDSQNNPNNSARILESTHLMKDVCKADLESIHTTVSFYTINISQLPYAIKEPVILCMPGNEVSEDTVYELVKAQKRAIDSSVTSAEYPKVGISYDDTCNDYISTLTTSNIDKIGEDIPEDVGDGFRYN